MELNVILSPRHKYLHGILHISESDSHQSFTIAFKNFGRWGMAAPPKPWERAGVNQQNAGNIPVNSMSR